MSDQLIDRYRRGASSLPAALKELESDDLDKRPVPDSWSIREIVLHLMDTEIFLAQRMKSIIAQPSPFLVPYDHDAFIKHIPYGKMNLDQACELIGLIRRSTADLLSRLPEEDFNRRGVHAARGLQTLTDVLKLAVEHWDHHRKILDDKIKMILDEKKKKEGPT